MNARRIALFLALAASSSLAFADRYSAEVENFLAADTSARGTHIQDGFSQLDTDGDGMVSRDEATNQPLPDGFWLLDRNRDGYLSPQEYSYRAN